MSSKGWDPVEDSWGVQVTEGKQFSTLTRGPMKMQKLVQRWPDGSGCRVSNENGMDSLQQLEKMADDVRMIGNNEMETLRYNATQPQTEWEWKTVGFRVYIPFLYIEDCIL